MPDDGRALARDAARLRARGLRWRQVAARLGVTLSAAYHACKRAEARAARERASLPPPGAWAAEPGPPQTRRCLRCAGHLAPVAPRALRCDTCGWTLAYDPATGLVVPAGYEADDLERLADILRDA